VRGAILSTSGGYLVFTNGTALRLAPGTVVPEGASLGSYVRAVLDRASRTVVALELEPRTLLTGEVGVAAVPREFVMSGPAGAPPAAAGGWTLGAAAGGVVTAVIDVVVPANTPASDDVYLSTERSNYSPAEIRMQRLDARDFAVSLELAGNTKLRYTFTRGSNSSVERDRRGDIVEPRTLTLISGAIVAHETVARWSDLP
jgi:hypothetical protein